MADGLNPEKKRSRANHRDLIFPFMIIWNDVYVYIHDITIKTILFRETFVHWDGPLNNFVLDFVGARRRQTCELKKIRPPPSSQ